MEGDVRNPEGLIAFPNVPNLQHMFYLVKAEEGFLFCIVWRTINTEMVC